VLSGRDIGAIIFIIVLIIAIIMKSDDILYAFTIFAAFMIVIGTIINICTYIKDNYRHEKAELTMWCFLVMITGPIAFMLHEIIYGSKDKNDKNND